ncbi:anaerobic nitric oxide reductase flavorubredoxin [hydrocarbon metagenome]|uniref:Anaerobic nitric oxide reductase flavorubredoxin n=1 Tax=hydrocarbon metagenome TaxID=938273 RepID=A0A0W8E6J8_9ZZZZ
MGMKISAHAEWVGKIDWELRKFHGEEYSTHKGSTYNSYLIQDQKNVLIDTVWKPFAREFVEALAQAISLQNIDYIVINHSEMDHSGALRELMQHIPEVPIYCTANGARFIKSQFHQDWNFKIVKTGDKLSVGSQELVFIEAPMLHWPDTMFSYLTGDKILFSNDAFGQHYASEYMYNDLVDQAELFTECVKYYANILTPFSPMVTRKIEEFVALQLPVEMICPSHGVIWRQEPLQIVNKYMQWSNDYQENQITILYDSMWENTRRMAEVIAQGIGEADEKAAVKLFNTARRDKNDIIAEVFKSKLILVGSSTINRGILSSVAGVLEEIKGLKFKGKKAAAFGSYGWSGESIKIISDLLKESGFGIINDGLKILWNPTEDNLEQCREFGRELVKLTQS